MTRRNFLGSVIGTLVITQMPFKAQGPNTILVSDSLRNRIHRAYRLGSKNLLNFQAILKTNQGLIWAPPVEKINEYGLKFIGLEMSQKIYCVESSIIDDEGFPLQYHSWTNAQYLCPYDMLHLTYPIDFF